MADDQCHIVYVPEYGLHDDRHITRGQSDLTKAERRAERAGETVSFHLNTMMPQWVLDQDGVQEDWALYEELFLTDFTAGQEYFTVDEGDDAGIIGCTAEDAIHRRHGSAHHADARAHLHHLPAKKSVKTKVNKQARLVIIPEQSSGGQQVANGSVVLVFRTEVTDKRHDVTVDDLQRPATEAIRPVKKEQLLLMVREYREQHDPDNAAGRPNLSDMLVGHEKHGRERSLRCELWLWYEQQGLLADDLLQTIFDEDLLGDFTWVSVDASQPNGAAAARPQPTARGWDAVWSAAWGWVFSNGAGAVQLVDPGVALTGEERAEGLGAARTPSNPEQREAFRQPAAGHAAMEEDDAPESQAGEL